MLLAQLETGVGNTRRFFPHVIERCIGTGWLSMGRLSKGLFDGAETSLFCKARYNLTK